MSAELLPRTQVNVDGVDRGMASVEFEQDTITIDARLIAEGFNIEPSAVRDLLRAGTLTSLFERGVDQDAGRFRLSFFLEGRRLRFIIDGGGRVLRRSLLNFGDRLLPKSARRPG
jgi:hypothetical protein